MVEALPRCVLTELCTAENAVKVVLFVAAAGGPGVLVGAQHDKAEKVLVHKLRSQGSGSADALGSPKDQEIPGEKHE